MIDNTIDFLYIYNIGQYPDTNDDMASFSVNGNALSNGDFLYSGDASVTVANPGDTIQRYGADDSTSYEYVGQNKFGIVALLNGEYFLFTSSTSVLSHPGRNVAPISAAPLDFETYVVPCYLQGTRVLTARGEVAVEDLVEGDLLITLSGAARPLRWIGQRKVTQRRIARDAASALPVRIAAGALGEAKPARDLWVSPDHCLYHDGALIQARELVNGSSVVQAHPGREIVFYHLLLDSHDVIWAEGAPSESYRPCGNVIGFGNARDFPADISQHQSRATGCFKVVRSGAAFEGLTALLAEAGAAMDLRKSA